MNKKHKRGASPAFDVETLTCSSLNSRGQGLCRPSDAPVTFVDGLLPGEVAQVQLVKSKKSYRTGKVIGLLEPSPHRVEPPCPWAGRCGGCGLAHCSSEGQLQAKVQTALDALRRIGGLALDQLSITPSPKQWGYRNKASFPVTPWGIGFYAAESHRLVPVDCCPLVRPELELAYQRLRSHPVIKALQPYDERSGRGLLRHLVLRSDGQGSVLLLLVLNCTQVPPALAKAAPKLTEQLGLSGLVVNFHTAAGNRVMTDQCQLLAGSDTLTHHLGPHSLSHDGTAFFQVNDGAAQLLFEAAAAHAQGRVVELFCGVGALTAFLAQRAEQVTAYELWAPAVEQAQKNLAPWPNARALLADAQNLQPQALQGADTLVVDPPRAGLSPQTAQLIAQSDAHRLVYVSCDPATLARDLSTLCTGPRAFALQTLQAFDLFPQTPHVEQLALLSR